MIADDLETFRRHDSGLYVPDDISRMREVWTKDELRLVDRVTKLMNQRNMAVLFACKTPGCEDVKITRVQQLAGDYVLRCNCKDRVFQRSF